MDVELDTELKLMQAISSLPHYDMSDHNSEIREFIDNLVEDLKFILDHHNEIVLDSNETCRLLGYASDEDDRYVIYEEFRGERIYSSMVGGLPHPLKGVIEKRHYDEVNRLFVLNNNQLSDFSLYNKEIFEKLTGLDLV